MCAGPAVAFARPRAIGAQPRFDRFPRIWFLSSGHNFRRRPLLRTRPFAAPFLSFYGRRRAWRAGPALPGRRICRLQHGLRARAAYPGRARAFSAVHVSGPELCMMRRPAPQSPVFLVRPPKPARVA